MAGAVAAAAAGAAAAVAAAKRHQVVIVGGGVAGLYTAHQLIKSGLTDVRIFEGRGYPGGRVRTTRDGDKKPLYNDFAWRVGEGNTRMLALAKELGIELTQQHTPESGAPSEAAPPKPAEGRAPLSKFATTAVESAALADQRDRESGYAGRISAVAFPGESHGDKHWFVTNGMNEYATKIADLLPEGVLNTGHLVTDVSRDAATGIYRVDMETRDGGSVAVEGRTVVLAAPPVSLRQFSVAKQGLNPALFAVHERRNGHIYAKCAPADNVPDNSTGPDRIYRAVPDSLLQQVISGDYGNNIFQAGYACDRFERVWRELQYQGPQTLKEQVQRQIDTLVEGTLPELKGIQVEEVYLRIGFVHRWQLEAHVSGKNKEQLSKQAIYPNPHNLPGLHLAGEAFSAHHGWTEGALQTAEDVAALILARDAADETATREAMSPAALPQTLEGGEDGTRKMLYRGLILDVTNFPEQHPGGAGPIKGFSGKDVSRMFDSVHPGWQNAFATIFGLQSGALQ